MLGIILILLIFGLIYFIYKTIYYKEQAEYIDYLRCRDELKKLEDEYTNGKYDFETYKFKKKQITGKKYRESF